MIEAERRIREALADEALHDEGASVSDTLYAAHVFEEACTPENIAALLAEIDRLTRERDEALAKLERERLRLAACGVVAMSNTPESAARNREMHADYRSASCDDVARAVDREMALRAERDAMAKDEKRLDWLDAQCSQGNGRHIVCLSGALRAAIDNQMEWEPLAQIEQERSEQKEGA